MILQHGQKGHPPHTDTLVILCDVPLVSASGPRLISIYGPAQTLAQVFLAPGAGLSRAARRYAEAHPLVTCHIRADGCTCVMNPGPLDFDFATLRWALRGADQIAIWSAPYPDRSDDYARWIIDRAPTSRFIATIETNTAVVEPWSKLASKWKRRKTPITFFESVIDQYKAMLGILD